MRLASLLLEFGDAEAVLYLNLECLNHFWPLDLDCKYPVSAVGKSLRGW